MIQAIDDLDFSRFTVEQKLTLIGRIWDSIEGERVGLTEEQTSELDRRVAAEEATGDRGITWAELKQRVQGAP